MRSQKSRRRLVSLGAFIGMALGASTMIVPFFWMASTALKDRKFVFTYPPQWIPDPARWQNFIDVWQVIPLGRGLLNSLVVCVLGVGIGLFSSTMAAFAFAKLDFPHKDAWFVIVLVIMMFPVTVVLIPQFLLYAQLGWIDTFLPLVLPFELGNASMIFFLRQFMLGLPSDLMDAARLDGASVPRMYWSVFLPLCRPAMAAYVIIVFMASWNQYIEPLIFTHSPDVSTVQLVIASLTTYYGEQTMDFPMMMTASVIVILPVVIVFLILQKHFIDSFAISGLKG